MRKIWSMVALLLCALLWAPSARSQGEQKAPPASPPAPPAGEEDKQKEPEAEAQAEDVNTAEYHPAEFDAALAKFYSEDYVGAAAGFWRTVHAADPSDDNYEWAQYFLAESLRMAGLWHGAVQYYYVVAKTRSRPEILPEALAKLEVITRRRPFSETLVYRDLLYDAEFGSLPKHLSNWVHYVQGLYDYRNDFTDWAERHFEQVSPTSYYGAQASYVQAVHALKKGKEQKAQTLFESIVARAGELEAPDVLNRTYLALARLHFDRGHFEKSLEYYNQVKQIDLSFEQAQLLLEKAWVHFYLQDYRKAMGLLHALRAPSYQRYFLPDAFVLRGLIFKDLCHHIPAKRVVREFRYTYGRTLEALHERRPLERNSRIFDGANQEGLIAERTAFLRTLQEERKIIDKYRGRWDASGLDEHLRRLYDLEMREQVRLWRMQFDQAADRTALHLLEMEEQINLLDYEIGLDIFKRLQRGSARMSSDEKLVVPYDSRNVYYEFDTEFWNDELHSYQFFITSRCFEVADE